MIRYTGWVGLGGPMYRLGKEAYSLLIVDNLRIRQDHFYWRHSTVSPRSDMKGLKKKSVVSQVWLFCFSGGNKTEEKEGWWSGHWLPKVPVLQIFLKYIYTFESVKQLCYIRIGWSQKKQHWDYHLTLSDPSFGSCEQKQSWVVFSTSMWTFSDCPKKVKWFRLEMLSSQVALQCCSQPQCHMVECHFREERHNHNKNPVETFIITFGSLAWVSFCYHWNGDGMIVSQNGF